MTSPKWKHFPRYWPFVRGIHRSQVNSPHQGQWRGPLLFSVVCPWINGWVNNREAGHLRRHYAHHDVNLMYKEDTCKIQMLMLLIKHVTLDTMATCPIVYEFSYETCITHEIRSSFCCVLFCCVFTLVAKHPCDEFPHIIQVCLFTSGPAPVNQWHKYIDHKTIFRKQENTIMKSHFLCIFLVIYFIIVW